MILTDTIASLATPIGIGAVSIIRISGDKSLEIAEKIFCSFSQKKIRDNPRYMLYGKIMDNNKIIDEVLLCYMKSPHSYTAEDVIEINSHGGYKSVERILNLILKNGARPAEKGEFTKRAFLNGRIDLSRAQAVIDIINAKSSISHDIANSHLAGKLFERIDEVDKIIEHILSLITVAIDFPDENAAYFTNNQIIKDTEIAVEKLKKLLSTYHDGKIVKDGINIAIIGKPNVGKSSLLNVLLDEERAIVTDIAGTTRDVITENMMINGIPINIIDTAGIRETDDKIEKIGVEKSLNMIENSDLIMLIIDGSKSLTDEDIKIMQKIKEKNAILIVNKMDLERKIDDKEISKYFSLENIIEISAKEKIGIDILKDKILISSIENPVNTDENVIITSLNHKNMIENAIKSLKDGKNAVISGLELDIAQIDYFDAWEYVGYITGKKATEELLDTVFANFCIGK